MDEIRLILWRYHLRCLADPGSSPLDKIRLFEELESRGYHQEFDLLMTWEAIHRQDKSPSLHVNLAHASLSGSNLSIQSPITNSALQFGPAIQVALKTLSSAVAETPELSTVQKTQALENVSFLSHEADLPKDDRHPNLLSHSLASLSQAISVVAGLAELWAKLGPQIAEFFK